MSSISRYLHPISRYQPVYTDTLTWLMGPNMHAVPACAHTASSYRAVQNGVHDICLLSPPPSRFAGILSSTAAAAATATAEAEAEAAEARVAAAQSAAAQSAAAWSAARAASGRQCGVVWRRECRHRDPTVRRRTDRRPRSLAGLNPPGWELILRCTHSREQPCAALLGTRSRRCSVSCSLSRASSTA